MSKKTEPVREGGQGSRVMTSVLLILLAMVSITAATVAWFTIADRTKVRSMSMEITSGTNLRFDLDAHPVFEEYVKTLAFEQIADRMRREKGFDMRTVPLEPVTTSDYNTFTLENGTVVESRKGSYLEFVLHFMAKQDMIVHLSSASSSGQNDGTAISSQKEMLPNAMRISFTIGNQTMVYDPGMGNISTTSGNAKIFGLPSPEYMAYTDDNALFPLKADVDQPVKVHIWLEGTDEACTDELRGADYSIRMRFVGTDAQGRVMDGPEQVEETESFNTESLN